MNKPELIAFDLDDTLLRDDGTISERTLHDLHRLAKEGIVTVIATGRMYATAKPYADLLALPDMPLILFSGALIQKISGEKLYEKTLSPELTAQINKEAFRHGWTAQTYINDTLYVREKNEFVESYERHTGICAVETGTIGKIPQQGADKILIHGRVDELPAVRECLRKVTGQEAELLFSRPEYLEIMAAGTSKGRALEVVCRYYKIDVSRAMAFGNGQNDTEMLKKAGFSVAVANSADEVKKAADFVTESNNEDGVAVALERFVL